MKLTEFKKLIRKEVHKVLKEANLSPEMQEISKVLYKIAKVADSNPQVEDDAVDCIIGMSTEVVGLNSKDVDEMLNEGGTMDDLVEVMLDFIAQRRKPQIEAKIKKWIRQYSNNFSSWKIKV